MPGPQRPPITALGLRDSVVDNRSKFPIPINGEVMFDIVVLITNM